MSLLEYKNYFLGALKQLEKQMNKEDFEELFSSSQEIHKFENDYVYILVPDVLTKFKIEKFYAKELTQFFNDLSSLNYGLKFITADEAQKENETKDLPITTPEAVKEEHRKRNLRAEFTFDNFVVGESNRFAFLSAMKVAENPRSVLNPLYLFGDVGLGKTHLMMAIGHYVLDNNIKAKVVYTSAQQFAEDYFLSTSTKKGRDKIEDFYNRYRDCDLLLVDDIQFLEGKTATQEEFFKVFDFLHEKNKQIVITSDRVANDLKLMTRLKSRFNWGMTVDIQSPDQELRVNILKRKLIFMINNPKEVPLGVLEFIASVFTSNIRDLEGALRRYITYCVSLDLPFTLENIEVALGSIMPTASSDAIDKDREINELKVIISEYFRYSLAELSSASRKSQIVYARNIAIYLIRELYKTPLKRIGEHFGRRDHATIAHSYDKIKESIKTNPHIKADIDYITQKLKN